jgi:hypothetical protein
LSRLFHGSSSPLGGFQSLALSAPLSLLYRDPAGGCASPSRGQLSACAYILR